MKNSNQSYGKILHFPINNPFIFTVTVGVLIFSLGIYALIYYNKKTINTELESATRRVEALWRAVTNSHEETMKAYFMYNVMNTKVLEILKKANSNDPNKRMTARAELFRTLWESYRFLSSNLYVRQFHFHLPNNISFLRFHAPAYHDDDLTQYRPTVAMTNKLKKPHFFFETGRVSAGYRYVFPIIDRGNNHLGSVELSRPFEVLRKSLNEIERNAGFQLLIRESNVMPKLLSPFKKYYVPADYAAGWVIEDPHRELHDSASPLKEEFVELLMKQKNNKSFREILESPNNSSIKASNRGTYYTITAIKLKEFGSEVVAATLIAVIPSESIKIEMASFKIRTFYWFIIIGLLSTITYYYLRQSNLIRQKQQELEAITSTMGSGLFITDRKGNIKYINDTGAQMLKYHPDEILEKNLHDTVHRHTGEKESCPIHQALVNRKKQSLDTEFIRKDGEKIDVIVNTSPLILDGKFIGSVVVFMDITERKVLERHLYTLSVTDELTSLYNRRFQIEVLINAKNNFERYGSPFSILMIDIDNFKSINDIYGHSMGDEVLKAIANSLNSSLRSTDIASRWGGEEFLVLLQNTDLESAVGVAERIRRDIEGLKIQGVGRVTVSIGVASFRKGESVENLITRADDAMYEAKASGKNRVMVSK